MACGVVLTMLSTQAAEAAIPVGLQDFWGSGSTLRDGDRITMELESTGSIDKDKIGIKFALGPNVSWWKGLQSGDKVICEMERGVRTTCDTQLWVPRLQRRGLQLWKAKVAGVHTEMYNVTNATALQGGNVYRFTWHKD